jgi:hypothetical protein
MTTCNQSSLIIWRILLKRLATIPKRTFEAFNKEFKKFGVFGFMDVVENVRLLLAKYNSIVWQHFKDFLVFKIILTVAMT